MYSVYIVSRKLQVYRVTIVTVPHHNLYATSSVITFQFRNVNKPEMG